MITKEQISLNVINAYIRHIREKFVEDDYLANRYLLILKIREWQLKRKLLETPCTLDSLQTLKTGYREAESFLFAIGGGSPKEMVQEINSILQLIVLEFHAEIRHIESQFPHQRRPQRKGFAHYANTIPNTEIYQSKRHHRIKRHCRLNKRRAKSTM